MTESTDAELIQATRMSPRLLSELAPGQHGLQGDARIHDICDDSRRIAPNDAFLCMPRAAAHTRDYVAQAQAAGAVAAILVGHECTGIDLPCLKLSVDEAGQLLRRWFATETVSTKLIGVTGTDGKTSVTWMLRQALERRLGKAWGVGTLGWMRASDAIQPLANTTPSLVTLHRILAAAQRQQVSAIAAEVSSHAIDQCRVAGLDFAAAIWTNLGHDHLQYHGGFAPYAATKAAFVQQVASKGGIAIGNADDPEVVRRTPAQTRFYGRGLYRQNLALAWEQELPGLLRLRLGGEEIRIEGVPVGEFHGENLAAAALALNAVYGIRLADLPDLLSGITAPPGRLQPLGIGRWQVYIDYAHTPEALHHCLESARKLARQRLLLVFGCGGERDREKRPQMGGIAVSKADVVWVTSDNPRSEPPEVIAAEIVDGMPQPFAASVRLRLDREQAIAEAVAELADGDVLVIAGKGHESYMEIKGQRLPWSDAEVASGFLRQKKPRGGLRACA